MLIALCMIIKNEELTIERCIKSAASFVNKVIVVDTGSTDNTIYKLLTICEELNLPLVLQRSNWVDFGHNRTELMRLAKDSADWLLLLDADMTVEVDSQPNFEPEATSYMVKYLGGLNYRQKLFVSGSVDWRYVGRTHEYIFSEQDRCSKNLEGIYVRHHGDGGSRADKFVRDRGLLELDLIDDPENSRTIFYLAETYKNLGMLSESKSLYLKRSQMDFGEEAWVSFLRFCTVDGVDVDGLLSCFNMRPWRYEPFYFLAEHFNKSQKYRVAKLFCDEFKKIAQYDSEDFLFIEEWMKSWGIDFQLGICSYYLGEVDFARQCFEYVLGQDIPFSYFEAAQRNLSFCKSA